MWATASANMLPSVHYVEGIAKVRAIVARETACLPWLTELPLWRKSLNKQVFCFVFLLWLHSYDKPIIRKVKSNEIAHIIQSCVNIFCHHNVSDALCPQSRDFVYILPQSTACERGKALPPSREFLCRSQPSKASPSISALHVMKLPPTANVFNPLLSCLWSTCLHSDFRLLLSGCILQPTKHK